MQHLPQTNVAAAELSTSMDDQPIVSQSKAVVVPSSSPNESVHLEIDKTDKNWLILTRLRNLWKKQHGVKIDDLISFLFVTTITTKLVE